MITDSINAALSRGASPDQIVQKIKESNPQKAASFDEAIKRGANSQMILDQIIKQNTKAPEKENVFNQSVSATDTSAKNAFGVGDAIVQGGIGVGKSVAETLMTPAKKLSLAQENVGAGNIAEQTSKGLEELTRQDNMMTEKYIKMSQEDPGRERLREMIKGNRAEMQKLSKGLSAEKEIGSATDERFKSLEATNNAQAIGKFAGDVTQFVAGGMAKTPTILSKIPNVEKVNRTINELSKLRKAGELNIIGKITDVAAKMGRSFVTDTIKFAPISAAVEGGDLKETAKSALTAGAFSAGGEVLSEAFKAGFPKLSKKMQESMLRMTPSEKTKIPVAKMNNAMEYAQALPLRGTPSMRYEQNLKRINDMEWGIQTTLEAADNAGGSASAFKLYDDFEKLANNLAKDSANAQTIKKQIMGAVDNLFEQYPNGNIPFSRLNKLKRSYANSAFDASGNRLLNEVKYGISEVLYKNIIGGLDEMGLNIMGKKLDEFNKVYSAMLTMDRLLKVAKNRNQAGFIPRMIAGFGTMSKIDGMIAGIFGGNIATNVLENTITPAKSIIAPVLNTAGRIDKNVIKGVGASLGSKIAQ